jgi:hypothetical protein
MILFVMINNVTYTSKTKNVAVKPVSSTSLDFLLGLEGLGGVEVLQGVLSNILPLPVVSIDIKKNYVTKKCRITTINCNSQKYSFKKRNFT